jgi:hypothetical protein
VSLTVAFAGILAGVIVWWLAVRRLTTRPWEAQGTADGRDSAGMLGPPPARIGLWILLAILTSLFALFITGYWMRMATHGARLTHDWHPHRAARAVVQHATARARRGDGGRLAVNRDDLAARELRGGSAAPSRWPFSSGSTGWRQLQAAVTRSSIRRMQPSTS